jgi:hypothetical protein
VSDAGAAPHASRSAQEIAKKLRMAGFMESPLWTVDQSAPWMGCLPVLYYVGADPTRRLSAGTFSGTVA